MRDYTSEIKYCSKELTKKESIKFKDLTNAIKLDSATNNGGVVEVSPDYYGELLVHNGQSKTNTDYTIYVLIDKSGKKYYSGSESFWTSLQDIVNEMADSDEEYAIEIYKKDSKNYEDKGFITCSIE